MDQELDAMIDNQPIAWQDPVSTNELLAEPLEDAPNDPVQRVDQKIHHESNGESSKNNPTDPQSQCILKDIRTKR